MKWVYAAVLLTLISCTAKDEQLSASTPSLTGDPLPSWNDGPLKEAIVAYVRNVTDSVSSSFIPAVDRIATFDNDGTLWAEKPIVQELFAFYRVNEITKKDPAFAKKQPFKAVVENDKEYFVKGGEKTLLQLIGATHTGMTEEEFDASVTRFFADARYPRGNVPLNQIVYQPQLELLQYLRVNGFKVFICSGGTIEVMRGISQQFYGIPKEQVIGTTFKYKFIDSTRSIMRLPEIVHLNDKEGKPVTIQEHIGRRPVFACGNEGGEGDIAMLKYSQGSKYPSFQMIINHDDSVREFSYSEKTNRSLSEATKNKWHIVSMKNDWKQVFPDK